MEKVKASDLKFEFGYFGTKGVTAHQLMMQFWKAVAVLEYTCNLLVIAAVSNGTSSNRAFYRIHQMMDTTNKNDVIEQLTCMPEKDIWGSLQMRYT